MKSAILSAFVLLTVSATPTIADVIVTDDAVVVQSDRAASRGEDEREDLHNQQPGLSSGGPTVITPDDDIEINNSGTAPQVLDRDENNNRGDNVIVVPDRN